MDKYAEKHLITYIDCLMLQIRQISAQTEVQDNLIQWYTTIGDRLNNLKVENDEVCQAVGSWRPILSIQQQKSSFILLFLAFA